VDQHMSNCHTVEVMAIVEGKTEQIFVEQILQTYLADKQIYINATQVSKPGQKGGDVHFDKVKRDLGNHLKQRTDTYITTIIDYYGIKAWPGLDHIPPQATPEQIAQTINAATKKEVEKLFSAQQADKRFIPYISVHEFEALLFSDSNILATELGINQADIDAVITKYGEPEAINNNPQTAPSKRLDHWSNGKFLKTVTGITIAQKITIPQIREKCRLFDAWLRAFEEL